ncbi:MAG TPA: S9 family peptidase [Bacteroidales bacterium]|nr:S9 family peptidase [Bacteroidales bacterium]
MKALPIASIVLLMLLGFSCKHERGKTDTAAQAGTEQPSLDSLAAGGVLTPELMWRMGRLSELQVSPDGKTLLYGLTRYRLAENKGNRELFVMPATGGEAVQITSSAGSEINARWKPDGSGIGYLSAETGDYQLWECEADGGNPHQVSDIPGGISGFEYSPDLGHILYTKDVKLDQTPQEHYPDLPMTGVVIADDLMYRHWDHWHDYAYSHVFFAPYPKSGKLTEGKDIMEGERYDAPMLPWGGMEQMTWSPDGGQIAYTCKKMTGRDYALNTDSEIFLFDLASGQTRVLSDPGFEGYDWDPVFSPDGKMLVWRSMEEPGFEADKERIILHDLASGSNSDLTEGFDQGCTNYLWSPDSRTLYFISGIHATYQVYAMDLASRKPHQITRGPHDYQSIALAGDRIIGTKMSLSMPTEIFAVDPGNGQEQALSRVNQDVLSRITLGRVEERWIRTTDQKDMLTWVVYPPDFDSTKTYPALLYCQGGPQSAVSQFWSYRWNLQMMAANGYIVVAPNRRGLPTFGQEWNDQISGDYGGQNMKDYLSAIDAVAAEPYVDGARLGAVGASYGGFSVFWLAGNHNKRFKAFISHCGMFNLESQYGSTEEYFFVNKDLGGPYWSNPRPASFNFSPHRFVDRWDTPIMIITGANDFRIPYTESLQAFNAAQLRGIPSRLLFFPEESHFVLKPQNAVLWQREFFRWLDGWLK